MKHGIYNMVFCGDFNAAAPLYLCQENSRNGENVKNYGNKKRSILFIVFMAGFFYCLFYFSRTYVMAEASSLKKENLSDGKYTVEVFIWKETKDEASMGDPALNHEALLTVEDGIYTMELATKLMTMGNITSCLYSLQIGQEDGSYVYAEITSNQHKLDNKAVPSSFSFVMPGIEECIPIKIDPRVAIMNNQVMDARLYIDWDTLKSVSKDTKLVVTPETGSSTSADTKEDDQEKESSSKTQENQKASDKNNTSKKTQEGTTEATGSKKNTTGNKNTDEKEADSNSASSKKKNNSGETKEESESGNNETVKETEGKKKNSNSKTKKKTEENEEGKEADNSNRKKTEENSSENKVETVDEESEETEETLDIDNGENNEGIENLSEENTDTANFQNTQKQGFSETGRFLTVSILVISMIFSMILCIVCVVIILSRYK